MNIPRRRNGEAKKRKIIRTAEKLFAKKGFNGVSIRELAEACGMSGPLILHHFKNKEGIYDAVKLALVEKYIPLLDNLENDEADLYGFIEKIIRTIFTFHRENPIALRLMDWDRLNGLRKPWLKSEDCKLALFRRLKRAVESGEIRRDVSPEYFTIMLIGMIHFWWEYRGRLVTEAAGALFAGDEEYIRQILLLVKERTART
ncbi:MAG: TetR/AcrR family transcriptional regulator [Victivallaceae bacterium]|nr:TetR/AcrR family transcriptional regulator [Victivallaceae bacterium]